MRSAAAYIMLDFVYMLALSLGCEGTTAFNASWPAETVH